MEPALVAAAIELAQRGVPVFSCRADKAPLTRHGFKDATIDVDVLRRHLALPGAELLGMPTGLLSDTAVIDIDPQGMAWLRGMWRLGRLPETLTHQTRRGGYHLIYRSPDPPIRNSASKIHFGVDTRGEGGYVVIPPSPGYTRVCDAPRASLPVFIVRALAKRKKQDVRQLQRAIDDGSLAAWVARSREGERNARLFWAACRCGEHGVDGLASLLGAALAIGLDEIEARRTIASGIARGSMAASS